MKMSKSLSKISEPSPAMMESSLEEYQQYHRRGHQLAKEKLLEHSQP